MIKQETILTLSVRETAAEPTGLSLEIRLDGEILRPVEELPQHRVQQALFLGQAYRSLVQGAPDATMLREGLVTLGRELFALWLGADLWSAILERANPGLKRVLVIASDASEIQNLPWECLDLPAIGPIARAPGFDLRRLPLGEEDLTRVCIRLTPRPLRVLVITSSPREAPDMGIERELAALLPLLTAADLHHEILPTGRFDALKERIAAYQPHLVHLIGPGRIENKQGYFAFERPDGGIDLRAGGALAVDLFRGTTVQGAILTGCPGESHPPTQTAAALAAALAGPELPFALAWPVSLAGRAERDLAGALYRELAAGTPIDETLVTARAAGEEGLAWTLPRLFAATNQNHLFDPSPDRPPVLPADHAAAPVRRRVMREVLPPLLSGETPILTITGPLGAGKGAVARDLAAHLPGETVFFPIAPGRPLDAARLVETIGPALAKGGLMEEVKTLNNPDFPTVTRLRFLAGSLDKAGLTLVLDGLDAASLENPEIAAFLSYLPTALAGRGARMILTLSEPLDLPAPVLELGGLPKAAFLEVLLRDSRLRTRMRWGEPSYEALEALFDRFNGLPATLPFLQATLPEAELAEIEGWTPDALIDRQAQQLDARHQTALRRFALAPLPLPADALGYGDDETDAWANAGLAVSREGLWEIPSLVKSRLTPPEDPETVHDALARYLTMIEHEDREGELGLSGVECFLLARRLHLAAGSLPEALAVSDRLSGFLVQRGLFFLLEEQNRELLALESHPAPLNWLGQSCFLQGREEEALDYYQKALAEAERLESPRAQAAAWHGIASLDRRRGKLDNALATCHRILELDRAAGDRAAEASTWHEMGDIDLKQGRLDAALNDFKMALLLRRELLDPPGEAATLHQLGMLALREEAREEGIRLVGLAFLIFRDQGRPEADLALKSMAGVAQALDLDPEGVQAVLGEAKQAFEADRAEALLERAFSGRWSERAGSDPGKN